MLSPIRSKLRGIKPEGIKKTVLFQKSEELIKAKDPIMQIMFLHHNYHNPIETLLLDDVYSGKVNEYTVNMKPRIWEDTDELDNE
ncbi:MAG: hypothetical protein O7D86_07770 [Proteobacteria bacterium]|nr:hypothetical protein [Pseudomonadota bacterium]